MDNAIKTIIYDLLQFRRSRSETTSIFQKLKHNADICPKLQNKLDSIFDSFEKYRRITYDIQGPLDEGVDVIIRQVFNEESNFICFQVKSADDLKEKNWLKTLKAQWFDAERTYHNMLDYYILLCCDTLDLTNKGRIRSLESGFSRNPRVHVIEPAYVLSFLRLSSIQVDAVIKSKFGSEDIIFRNALSITNDLTPTENSLLFYLVWSRIYGGSDSISLENILDSPFIEYVYSKTPDFERDWFFEEDYSEYEEPQEYVNRNFSLQEKVNWDIESLEDIYIQTDNAGNYSIDLGSVQPIAILMMDGNERYCYSNDTLLFYMMDVFGPHKGYESKEDNSLVVL